MSEMNAIAKRIIAEWGMLAYFVAYAVFVGIAIGVMRWFDERQEGGVECLRVGGFQRHRGQ